MVEKTSKIETLIAVILLTTVSIINFSQLFLLRRYPINESDLNMVFASLYYSAKEISLGHLPLWNNLFFTGQPFYDQEILAHPLNFLAVSLAPLLKIFADPYFAFSLIVLIQFILMGVFSYIISRKVFGLSILASYFPAIIYMLNMGQEERVFMMPGGFMVAPLLIFCAYKISEEGLLFYSLLGGILHAIGFFFGSCISIGWASLIYVYFLVSFLIIKHGLKFWVIKRFLSSLGITYLTFIFLAAAAFLPFFLHLPLYQNLLARYLAIDLTNFVDWIRLKTALSDIFFGNIFGLENIISAQAYNFPILTGNITQSLPAYVFFGGSWNYLTVLLIPMFLFFLMNIKLFDGKEKAVGLLLIGYFLHTIFLSFNHIMYLELFLFRGHNLFVKLHFIMQLIGGLFIGITLTKFLNPSYRNAISIRSLRISALLSILIFTAYSILNTVFLSGLAIKVYSKNNLSTLVQNIFTYTINNLPSFSYIKTKFGPEVLLKINNKAAFLITHFVASEFTINYMLVFTARLLQIFLFLWLIKYLFRKNGAIINIKILLILILLFLTVDRVNTLKLYSPFNRDAPKNFSESYREVQYLKGHINSFQRVVVVSNDYESICTYVKQGIALPGDRARASLQIVNEQVFYNSLKDFPELTRNGAPLVNLFNLPLDINTINGLYTDVSPEIWEVYNRMNLRSRFYRARMESTRGSTNVDLNCYNVESPLYDLLGVKYVLSSMPLESQKLKFIFRGDKYFVYENKKAFPRVWVADKNIVLKDRKKILESLDSGEINMRDTVFSDEPILLYVSPEKLSFAARILQYKPDSVQIEVTVNKRSIMVLTDTFSPDWHVQVNGAKKKIEKVDYFLRGVVLEPGLNIVIFNFRPLLFYLSCAVSVLSLFILACYFVIRHKAMALRRH